ncbi:MAG: DUF5916 domain-containing protein, partial [Bacteroidota bacterium]
MINHRPIRFLGLILLIFFPNILSAQSSEEDSPTQSIQEGYQVHIARTADRMKVDGKLDESAWEAARPAENFWIAFPTDGVKVPANIQTSVKLTYDDNFIYVGATCYGPNDYIITTLKRDNPLFWNGDVFGVMFDPVNNASNGFSFATNPAGVQTESLISGRTGTRGEMNSGGSSGFNTAWDNKWYVEVAHYEKYWTVEMAIPFNTLRYETGKKTWGINFSRGEPRSNAWHAWTPVPVQFLTVDLGYTGQLIWDEAPKKVKSNISLIPYGLVSYDQDFEEGEEANTQLRMGGDAKVAITSTLNLDLTVNPDFSQVEVDQQVTNLTTFNVRFPERRLFFLENSDLFANFGIPPMRPFFSRRIGLDEDGNTIPIAYGARLSGNLTKTLRVGLMNMQTRESDDFASQNYTSLTLHQRVLDRSVIKGYFHNRQAMKSGEFTDTDFNRTAGAEFNYFSQDAKWQGFGGGGFSLSDGLEGDNYFYNIGGGYDGKNFSVYTNFAGIGDNYFADMGWIPSAEQYDAVRDTSIHIGFHHWYTRMNYTLFPKDQSKVNAHIFGLRQVLDVDNSFDFLQQRIIAGYTLSKANTSGLMLEYTHEEKNLLFPFDFTDGEPLPAGRYSFDYAEIGYQSDRRAYFAWAGGLQYGSFYNGTRLQTTLELAYRVQPWGNFGLNFVYNKLEFPDPYGEENLLLLSPRFEVNFTRNLFWTTFLQFNTQNDNF